MTGAAAYLLRRAAVGAALLLVLTAITFVLFYAVPTQPAGFLVDLRTATPEEIQRARDALGVALDAVYRPGGSASGTG